ncbi:uncharacterized protein Grl40a [Drosophila bipectinata]|uniref:uncharacterized protein Grl40a n=1 Tax=Drosophila bipectinata TaxID=42026 RepID=UPI001C89B541|nr:uncharacterized protein LOC108124284 [Drosophila bipectinata]
MENSRVLRCTNVVLLLTGYQIYWYDIKSQRFLLSLPGVVNIFVLGCIYAGCFAQHFDTKSSLLKVLQDVSPFLFGLTRMQLLVGVKALSYAVYSSVKAIGAINSLVESLPRNNNGFCKDEVIAYAMLGSTFGVLTSFGFYIAYEMKFELPPLQDAMIGAALFMPHWILAGSVRLYTILAWLTRGQMEHLQKNIEEVLSANMTKEEPNLASTSFTVSTSNTSLDYLESLRRRLEILGARFNYIFKALQYSLIFLFCLNFNCLLGGIYSFIYYRNTWHVLFEERKQRIFYAANASIYACIACDYLCLMFVQFMMEKKRLSFLKSLDMTLSQRSALPKKMRSLVKDIKVVLFKKFQLKFQSIWSFDMKHFSLLVFLQIIIIALIVMFLYLNDEINLLREELNSKDDE